MKLRPASWVRDSGPVSPAGAMAKRGKTKNRKRMPKLHPIPMTQRPAQSNPILMELKRIFQTLGTITMGCCHSGVKGVSGSIRPTSLFYVLTALAYGFCRSTGWEFVENKTQRVAFELTKTKLLAYCDATWIGQDILTLVPTLELCGEVTSAYAFWVGFPKPVQLRILELCRSSFTNICSVAVFLDSKWRKAEQGTVILLHSCDN